MFVPQHHQHQSGQNDCENGGGGGGGCVCNENVYWMVDHQPPCSPSRYKSPFSAMVRWEAWLRKNGCCKTIGPPPNVCMPACPEHFLRKHSRRAPKFFTPEELRARIDKEYLKRFEYHEPPPPKKRFPPLDTGATGRLHRQANGDDCPFPRPPSRMGLFRHPTEPSYEQRYKFNKALFCNCDWEFWQQLMEATECAGVMAAQMEKEQRKNGQSGEDGGPVKDFIRSNALEAIRMPARRLRRCYVDKCGVHLIDMSDSPYVLRPGFGKVPSYIHRRKMELYQKDIQAKRRMEERELEEAANAQGVQLVDAMEKESVINGLKQYWGELLNEYSSLPLLSDTGDGLTERQRELKHNLEERMKEIEQDLRLLTSSGQLFVGDVKESRYL